LGTRPALSTKDPLDHDHPVRYEAFLQVSKLVEHNPFNFNAQLSTLKSGKNNTSNSGVYRTSRSRTIKDFPISEKAAVVPIRPFDTGGIINAAAYPPFLLTQRLEDFLSTKTTRIADE